MTREQAHEILDAAVAGAMVSCPQILEALRATGDLCAYRPAKQSEQVEQTEQTA